MNWETIIIGVLAALPGLWGLWLGRKKLGAETAVTWSDALDKSIKTCQSLQEQVDELRNRLDGAFKQIDRLKDENRMLRDGINQLIGQLKTHGIEPVWIPTDSGGTGPLKGAK